ASCEPSPSASGRMWVISSGRSWRRRNSTSGDQSSGMRGDILRWRKPVFLWMNDTNHWKRFTDGVRRWDPRVLYPIRRKGKNECQGAGVVMASGSRLGEPRPPGSGACPDPRDPEGTERGRGGQRDRSLAVAARQKPCCIRGCGSWPGPREGTSDSERRSITLSAGRARLLNGGRAVGSAECIKADGCDPGMNRKGWQEHGRKKNGPPGLSPAAHPPKPPPVSR